MKDNLKYIVATIVGLLIGGLLVNAIFFENTPDVSLGGVSNSNNNLWKLSGGNVLPSLASWGVRIPGLTSENCVGTDSNGVLQSGTCTGGGGESGSIFSTTTSGLAYQDSWEVVHGATATSVANVTLEVNGLFFADNATTTKLTFTNGWGNLTGALTGNADTATGLAANGTNCAAGEVALGVDSNGAAEGCYELTEADITDLSHIATGITDGLIIEPDLNGDNTPSDGDWLQYDSTGTNFVWRTDANLRSDVGLVIGTNVQAWDAQLDIWAGVTPSANGQSLVSSANYASMRGLLDLEAGTDFYSISAADSAFEAELDNSAGLLAALSDETGTGAVVFGTTPTFSTNLTVPLILGGTGTTQDLSFQTTSGVGASGADIHFLVGNNGSTEAMTILNNGNVGIGTTTPQNVLSVVYSGSTVPGVSIQNINASGFANGILIQDEKGNPVMEFGYNNNSNESYNWGGPGVDMKIGADASEKMRILGTSGNVGIATTSPEARLDVWGASSGKVLTLFSDAGTKFMEMLNTGVTTLLGVWDFGGATSLEIPNGADPTVNATGEIAVKTATSTVEFYDGTNQQVLSPYFDLSFQFGSTTLDTGLKSFDTGTTTFYLRNPDGRVTLTGQYCKTNAGTLMMNVGDGTNWADILAITSSGVEDASIASNGTFNDREDIQVRFGTGAATPDRVQCTLTFKRTP